MKTIKVQKDQKTGDAFLKIEDFKDMVDISKVVFYELKPLSVIKGDNTTGLSLKFYDKNKKLIKTSKK